MKYRDRTTGQIYTLFELQQKFFNTSFPEVWSTDTFDYVNCDSVTEVPPPVLANIKHRIEFDGVQLINGTWTETWKEVPKFDDITEQTAWETECVTMEWNNVRTQRDILLSQTDYIQLTDTPITSECRSAFVTYRQQLRDVTTQSDPYNISWPTVPSYIKQNN